MRKLMIVTLALAAGTLLSGASGAWAKGAPRIRVHTSRPAKAPKKSAKRGSKTGKKGQGQQVPEDQQ